MITSKFHAFTKKISLSAIIFIPFIAITTFSVVAVGYISFKNGREAVNDVSHQLRSEITNGIQQHVSTFLATPHAINQFNAETISQGLLDIRDTETLAKHFWNQIQLFDTVTSIYFGYSEGGMIGAGREGAEGTLYITATEQFSAGPWGKYSTDSSGNRNIPIVRLDHFDARTRPWFSIAAENQTASWSKMYILFTGQDLAIAASSPVYDTDQNLVGVTSIDIFASHLSSYLGSLKIGNSGFSFIMERSGLLVASSTDEKPIFNINEEGGSTRLSAETSQDRNIRSAVEFLKQEFGNYANIPENAHLEYELDGNRQFMQVSQITDVHGIDWLLIVVIPEDDFMAQINQNNLTTGILIGAALALAIIAGTQTTRWIYQPIQRLILSTQSLAEGTWHEEIPASPFQEIDELNQAFNDMARQLQDTLANLINEISERQKAEESLIASETQLKSAQEMAQIGNWEFRVAESVLHWSDELYRIFGLEIGSPISLQKLLAYTHPDDRETLKQQIESGDGFRSDYRIVLPDGQIKYIQETVGIQTDENGNTLRTWGTAQDITARKQAEKLIVESQLKYKQLADELEERVEDRTHDLRILVNAMAGREVRMAELKRVIKMLRAQIEAEGLTPAANDPLIDPPEQY